MKTKLIHSEKFEWEGVSGWSFSIGNKVSVTYIEIATPISKRRSLRCDRIYYILSGTARFQVGNETIIVNEKEAVRIPKKTTYSYKPTEKIKLVEVNLPPYDEKYEEVDL